MIKHWKIPSFSYHTMKYFLVDKKVMDGEKKTWSIILYKTPDGTSAIDVKFEGETVWLNEEQMAKLFGKGKSTINEHIIHIYIKKEN